MTSPARTLRVVAAARETSRPAPRIPARTAGRVEMYDAEFRSLLAHLRVAALACRSSARVDLFETCVRLSLERDVAVEVAADALLRVLPLALGHGPVIFRPGVDTVSFDEAWLLRALSASRADDAGSLAFLMGRRVPEAMRRQVAFLLRRVARAAASPR